ncbi:hypothetical protein SDC9_80319 [bioreactor metagenome]|uniref:Colicin V production protein n=1 Tax=bioreactor metagenome TaxID=1076179 RepID=A0A644Z157_9ZZZZ
MGEFIRVQFIGDFFRNKISDRLAQILNTAASNIDVNKLFTDKPTEFMNLLKTFNINFDELNSKLAAYKETAGKSATDFVTGNIADPCSKAVAYVIAFIAIIIVSLLLLKLIIWFCDLIVKLPVLHAADTLLGMITGVLIGLIGVYVFCILVNAIMPYIIGIDNPFFAAFNEDKTLIFKIFSQNNPIERMISVVHTS